MSERRPAAVAVVAAFLFAATAMAALVGISLVFPGRMLRILSALNPRGMAVFGSIGHVSGVLMLVLALVTAAGAIGLLRRKRWAWWLSVVLFAVSACGDLAAAFATHEWLRSFTGFFVSTAFLCVLSRPALSGYCGDLRRTRGKAPPSP